MDTGNCKQCSQELDLRGSKWDQCDDCSYRRIHSTGMITRHDAYFCPECFEEHECENRKKYEPRADLEYDSWQEDQV